MNTLLTTITDLQNTVKKLQTESKSDINELETVVRDSVRNQATRINDATERKVNAMNKNVHNFRNQVVKHYDQVIRAQNNVLVNQTKLFQGLSLARNEVYEFRKHTIANITGKVVSAGNILEILKLEKQWK